ncbi:hypothetical protein Q3G72_005673 [Acer saccharum]|nr:hypothetical protein Q3G72_005673 [Acer saccharum]
MDARNGKILWSIADPSNALAFGPVTLANGVLFAGSTHGKEPIYAMMPKPEKFGSLIEMPFQLAHFMTFSFLFVEGRAVNHLVVELIEVEGDGMADVVFRCIQEMDIDNIMHIVLSGGSTMYPVLPSRYYLNSFPVFFLTMLSSYNNVL